MNINNVLNNNRMMKALTGLTIKEFYILLPTFENILLDEINTKTRIRVVGGGRKGTLRETEPKLFFILFYLKTYPTQELAAFIFGVHNSQIGRWVNKYLPIVEKALGRKCCLPKRRINSIAEFVQCFPAITDILIDGVERRIQRPKNPKAQRRCYSGKKKFHTRKNTIIADFDRHILLLSPTKNGKIHDKKQLEKEGTINNIPKDVSLWVDKGFQGIAKLIKNGNEVLMPKKKPRGRNLTEEQKGENKIISGIRMRVEHTIGGMKRYGCLSQIYRNKNGIDDEFTYVCAGLWNFHLKCA
jgi:hypothetical protein